MPITQVYDVFRDNIDEDSTLLWFHVKTSDNRSVYFHIDYEKQPVFSSLLPIMDLGPSRAEHLRDEAAKLIKNMPGVLPDFSGLPQIEDTSLSMQEVFSQLEASDSMMSFVDFEDHLWEDLNLTQEEFENQMDADIDKYGLSDVIVKGEDESLYICYADLLTKFSMPAQHERVQEKEWERDDGMSGRNGDKIEFAGLVLALHYYNEDGKIGKCGSWEIHDGGYDRWWELCYNGEPLISCYASGEYLNGKELGNLERERSFPDEIFSDICKVVNDKFPECRMSPKEEAAIQKVIKQINCWFDEGLEKMQIARFYQLNSVRENVHKQPRYQTNAVKLFAKEFFEYYCPCPSKPSKEVRDHFAAATKWAVTELMRRDIPSQEIVETILDFSPMAELTNMRTDMRDKRMKCAMGIVLDAQREIEHGKGLDVGKEEAASL